MKNEKARFFAQYIESEVDISSTKYFQEQAKWNKPVTTCKLFGIRSDLNKDWNIAFMQTNIITQNEGVLMFDIDVCSLLLKPVSAISDEDAIQVAKIAMVGEFKKVIRYKDFIDIKSEGLEPDINMVQIFHTGEFELAFSKSYEYQGIHGEKYVEIIDFLRSKGYALPFMQYSVEQLIEMGWVKLKTD